HQRRLLQFPAPGLPPWLPRRPRFARCFLPLLSISFLARSLLRLWRILQRKAYLQIVAVDHQPDRSLPGFATHAMQERTQFHRVLLNRLLARVALDDDWFVKEQSATLGVITPHTRPLGKSRGPTEQVAQNMECFINPSLLVNSLVATVLARDEQHQQR